MGEVVVGEFVSGGHASRSRIGVDQRLRQAGYLMEQPVVGALGDGVGRSQGEPGVGDNGGFGPELMAHPPDSDPLDPVDTLHPAQHPLDLVNQPGVHAVHQPPWQQSRGPSRRFGSTAICTRPTSSFTGGQLRPSSTSVTCAGDPATDLAAAWMLLPGSVIEVFEVAYGGFGVALRRRSLAWAVLFAVMLLEIGLNGRATYETVGRATLKRAIAHSDDAS